MSSGSSRELQPQLPHALAFGLCCPQQGWPGRPVPGTRRRPGAAAGWSRTLSDGGIVAIRDGTGRDLRWTWHGWLFTEGRPTRLGALLWKAVHLKGMERVVVEGPATPGKARTVTHEDPDPGGNPWLYLLNPHLRRLALLVAASAPALPDRQAQSLGLPSEERHPVRVGSAWYYTSLEGYTFELVSSWDLRVEKAPDWKKVEEQGRVTRALGSRSLPLPAEQDRTS